MTEMIRDLSLDFLKGIAIVLMVLGHALDDWADGTAVRSYIYLFHMPVFFIAAGCVFNAMKVQDRKGLKYFALKKIKRLWFPYVLWTSVFTLLNGVLVKVHIVDGTIETFKQLAYNCALIGRPQLEHNCMRVA